jgi:hypothetical protein
MTQTQDPAVTRPVGTGQTQDEHLAALGRYQWGWAPLQKRLHDILTSTKVRDLDGMLSKPSEWV